MAARLRAGWATLSDELGWNYSFTGLARYDSSNVKINYTVAEDPVAYYQPEYVQTSAGFDIVNTLSAVRDGFTILKVCKDEGRPSLWRMWSSPSRAIPWPSPLCVTTDGEGKAEVTGLVVGASYLRARPIRPADPRRLFQGVHFRRRWTQRHRGWLSG